MFIKPKLSILYQRLAGHIDRLQSRFSNSIARKISFNKKNFVQYLSENLHFSNSQKADFIQQINGHQKIIFYVFRDLHLIDWFLPIHSALNKRFPGQFAIFYINFGSTLKKIGSGFEYLPYLSGIEERLAVIPGVCFQHFSDLEISLFDGFPDPDMILTTETIRKEKFNAAHRVYLPHYTVPKANETLPLKIRYNHVFIPTKPDYSYYNIKEPQKENLQIHQIGYPKMFSVQSKFVRLFENDNPVVIYAPSLNIELIENMMERGILEIFKRLSEINFIFKLHPTLSSKMHTLYNYLQREIKDHPHIVIDSKTNIQNLGTGSSLMITDFGSIGAEYCLGFGKRVIYLEVPDRFEGGADLHFRNSFADAIAPVEKLETAIRKAIAKGDLGSSDLEKTKNLVLYNWQDADLVAAEKINEILSH
jgi:hypothetical protein